MVLIWKGRFRDFVISKLINSFVLEAIKGSSVVVSLLGPPLKRNYEGTPIVDVHTNIILAMKDLDIKRVLTVATPSVKFEKDKKTLMTIMPAVMGKHFLQSLTKRL